MGEGKDMVPITLEEQEREYVYRRGTQDALAAVAKAIDDLRGGHPGRKVDEGLALASKAVLDLMRGGIR